MKEVPISPILGRNARANVLKEIFSTGDESDCMKIGLRLTNLPVNVNYPYRALPLLLCLFLTGPVGAVGAKVQILRLPSRARVAGAGARGTGRAERIARGGRFFFLGNRPQSY